ncbi:maleylacetoacetate isomerase [Reinekea sp.]|jgi:maleylacetoacetate isomerase|uniref:maleylacetoacetate isomerase n=1 Tax=Reinekea sp. TaxID=1970455 RepID=UPI002A80A913|nr:maleylacetoacetate isomerase [Reinekea sp.]
MIRLYSYYRSSAAFRVRIGLNLKGLPYQTEFINIKPGVDQQNSMAYRQLNPQGRVPFLIDGDFALSQSTAILEYLEEAYPEPRLLPEALGERARVRQLVNIIACDIHPLNNLSVLNRLRDPLHADDAAVAEWYQHWLHRGLETLERLLAPTAGRYCVGDQPTLADLYLVPQVWNAKRFAIDLSAYPSLVRLYEQALVQPAVFAALPERQADNPDFSG